VVGEVLAAWGVDGRGAVVADGSGLSRYTYLTAGTLVEVLARMYRNPDHRARIMAALPVAGRDGTLRRRLVGTAAEGVARAKTGSMRRVRALAGYVETADGESLAFAMLANNFSAPAAEVTRVIDEAVATLAAFSRR
jgi:D-alanyl-D-alanine carboxypeptidase/D-alanyl-D-alanine-endopeptidase (penicillin-binding protein 4)